MLLDLVVVTDSGCISGEVLVTLFRWPRWDLVNPAGAFFISPAAGW